MDTGAPQAPSSPASEPALLTATQVGKLLNPPRSKRRVLQWAEEQPEPCPHTVQPRGSQTHRFFVLDQVKAWAASKGYLGGEVLQEATLPLTMRTPTDDPAAPGPSGVPDFDAIEALLLRRFSNALQQEPRKVGDQIVADPAGDQKTASAVKNLISEWRRLREQRHAELLRSGKVIDRRKSEELLQGLCEIFIAGTETFLLDVARVVASITSQAKDQNLEREAIERLSRSTLRPLGDALRRRLSDYVSRQLPQREPA